MEINNLVGGLIIANIGLIATVIGAVIKLVWHLAKKDSEIKDAKSAAVRAHKRIDKITGDVGE